MNSIPFMGYFLILLIPAMMGMHALYLKKKGRWMILDPLNAFWVGAIACYVFQPLAYYDKFVEWYTEAVVWKTLLWILFTLFFIIMGYEGKLGQLGWTQRRWKRLGETWARLAPGNLAMAGLALMGLGFVGYAYMIATAGSLERWLSVGRGGTNFAETIAYINNLEHLLPIGVMLLLFHVEFHRVEFVKRIAVWALGGGMWLWLIYLGSRSRTIVFAGVMVAAYFLPKRKNPSLWIIIPGCLLLLPLVNFIGAYRGQFQNLSFQFDRLDWEDVKSHIIPSFNDGEKKVGIAKGAEFSCVAAAVDLVPSRVGFNYGYIFLELFTRPIPRAIWPEKLYPAAEATHPLYLEGDLSRAYVETGSGSYLTGPSLTFVGFYYAMGGPIACAVFGYLTGAAFRAIRSIYDRDPTNQGNMILYLFMLPTCFGEAAAMPMFWVFSQPLLFIPLVIFIYLCREKTETSYRGFPVVIPS